jgi:hypothetical protein
MTTATQPTRARTHTARKAKAKFAPEYSDYTFANPKVEKAVKKFVREQILCSPEASREFLQRVGILTKTGRLSKKYGG